MKTKFLVAVSFLAAVLYVAVPLLAGAVPPMVCEDPNGLGHPVACDTNGTPSQAISMNANCQTITCGTVGDGGVLGVTSTADAGTTNAMTLTAGASYSVTVDTSSPVQLRQGGACVSYGTTGAGLTLNEGTFAKLTIPASSTAPIYLTCCAKTAGVVVGLCPMP